MVSYNNPDRENHVRSTTVIGIRRDGKVAMGSDGQVTIGNTIMKHNTRKIRKLYNDKILVGFAGASADAFTLFEKFEGELEKYKGNVHRAAVELAKLWRTDKYLRRLEALLTVMDTKTMLVLAAARALIAHSHLSARKIVEESLKIASKICIYTNDKLTIMEL
jgi:ATP-dependent HslUV protease subunit HslV